MSKHLHHFPFQASHELLNLIRFRRFFSRGKLEVQTFQLSQALNILRAELRRLHREGAHHERLLDHPLLRLFPFPAGIHQLGE